MKRPVLIISGVVLLFLLALAIVPGSTVGLGDFLKGKTLYDVRCDASVSNLPLLDAKIQSVSCQNTFSTIASCVAPFSASSFLGLSDELNLQGELAGKVVRSPIEVNEGTVFGEDFSVRFRCVPEGTHQGRFSLFTVEGNFVDQLTKNVQVP